MGHNTYVVIETKNITQSMVNESLNSSHPGDTFRKSLDCVCSILKFEMNHPDTMGGYVKYDHAGISTFLSVNSADWIESE